MDLPNADHVLRLAQELSLKVHQVATTAQLLKEGATVPFIARYRKEATGELDEVQITSIRDRLEQMAAVDERRAAMLVSLKERNLLTDALAGKLSEAQTLTALEDIYLPFRPKKRTRATAAREKGLEPLAELLWAQDPATDPAAAAAAYVGREYTLDDGKNLKQSIATTDEALAGARDILAERIADDAGARAKLRAVFHAQAVVSTKVIPGKETEGAKFKDYFEWSEPLAKAPSHRVLAMRRGEKELFLMMRITVDETAALAELEPAFVKARNPVGEQIRLSVQDSYKRLLAPALETEMRIEAKKRADETAIRVFADNLRELLLASPLGQKNVLAIDPGFRTGCKVVILDRQGKLLHNDVVYPEQGAARTGEASEKLTGFVKFFSIEAIAIGNGTAGRETELFVRSLGLPASIPIVMVNESGASIYSASEVAREEFPDHDLTVRGAVSIGRRLMDPLAELVKLDPKSIGVGQYQHDVDQNALKRSLDDCVISSVNGVGVEVNTASKQLLSYVSGLNSSIAANIVAHRDEKGPFKSRQELLTVSRLGPKAFEQAAGFLRIRDGEHPLDASAVHPESYPIVEKMAADLGVSIAQLVGDAGARKKLKLESYVSEKVGLPTLNDIVAELAKPGRDPRQKFEAFSFAEGVNKPEDLKSGMKLPGIVTNVTAFGAFVDIGVHQDGLVHVSQLADTFVKDPAEVVKVSQKVTVTVTEVDLARKRIALSMRSKPELGPKNASGPGASGQRTSPGQGARPSGGGGLNRSPAPAPRQQPNQSLTGDWFSAALNKKR
ncbi:Tex family protein [Nibricoccus sp. IMCC34717]|uniref:Tex family protein n=1 Tax=Nibricoccus sp. IMCC34717 TaxID=3034021 RepID=UPI00384FEA2B